MSDDDESDTGDEDDEHERKHDRHRGELVRVPEAGHLSDSAGPARPLAFIERAQDVLTVKRVFGEPVERDGVTVIPAVSLGGGGGGGSGGGEGAGQRGSGQGGGFGVSAKPAGAFVIREGRVRWEPALDLNRTIFMGQLVAIVFFLTVRSVVKALATRR
ncbi:MAG: hypothetical protein HYY42_06405 [Chloroflexi bacterium]|nr:hypothetical protein [Chloroflexota bacterium]MBI2983791.1 hypothetical protein [Chloroflexota bacterium]